MSEGPRLALPLAKLAGEWLLSHWAMRKHDALVVGSVRRERLDVGDIEFACRAPADGERDELFEAIDATLETPGLFGEGTVPVGRAVKGFKRGFLHSSFRVTMTNQETKQVIQDLPVEIYRWAADDSNRGWITLMRTGPAEFNRWFLSKWKRQFNIPHDRQASDGGVLLDMYGNPVRVESELDCFDRAGCKFVAPQVRAQVGARTAEARP